jgi:hypothetical protein
MTRKFWPIPRFRNTPRKGQVIDGRYMEFIRSFPCFVCVMLRHRQATRTEAAHVGQRGLSQKCSDRETLPLCGTHHRTGEHSHHRMGKKFWTFWGISRIDLIAKYQQQYEKERRAA